MLLGENFFPLLILAFGAAIVVGTAAALFKKPQTATGISEEPVAVGPVTLSAKTAMQIRSGFFIVCGLVMVAWALASLG